MELKTNYQYTYFIHPFIIKDGKYQKYILKMLKDKNCKLKVFEKAKDLRTYQYFLPRAREFLFSSFSLNGEKIRKLEELPLDTRSAVLSKYDCNIFEYTLKNAIQGKIDGSKGIFFTIQKIDVICFKTGIGFVAIKTNVEDEANFSNILNFNYKFRDINQEGMLDAYDNIRLQTNSFDSAETFKEFIKEITGSNLEAMKLDIDTERFLTYSYVCIDQDAWNQNSEFKKIKHYFLKYSEILPADSSLNVEETKIQVLSRWKYANLAISKLGITLLSSSVDMNNYTILPNEYENEYLYTYIFNLYKKIYLKKILLDFRNPNKVSKARKAFIEFTNNLWIQEITEDETGTMLNYKIAEVLELEKLYQEVKNKYDVLYKDLNIEKNNKTNIAIIVLIIIAIVLNAINFFM